MQKEKLLIIGAGISGLVAANEVIDKYEITILEAAAKPGGRIHSVKENGFPNIIEGGAEFIHGNLKHTIGLLKEAGIKYVPIEGKMYRKKKDRWVEEEEQVEGWDELMKEMKKQETASTLYEFLQQHFGEEKYTELRKQATGYAEGFDLADVKKVSVKALYKEWDHEDEVNYRIPEGYCALINYLENKFKEKGGQIIYSEMAKQVDHEGNNVIVLSANGNRYEVQKVLITIPVSLLQLSAAKPSINFTPSIDDHINAANDIGFGSLVKLLFLFKERFWKPDTGFVISEEAIPTWWTQLPDTTPLLTGWAGGRKGDALTEKTDSEIIKIGLDSLSKIYALPPEQLRNNLTSAKIFNWQKNELALGAYSYSTPRTAAALKILNTPINDILFFCGEALYQEQSPGTVEAAIISARRVAALL